jgi:hypothetical protein
MWIMFFLGIGLGVLAPLLSRWLTPRAKCKPVGQVQQPQRLSLGALLWLLLVGSPSPLGEPLQAKSLLGN